MKVNYLLLFLLFLFSTSCNQNESKSYFPFQAYLTNDLNQIDSLPIAIFKYSTHQGKTDSTIIDKKQFRKLVTGLFSIDLQNEDIMSAYDEQVIEDTDIENIAIHYSTKDDQFPIKQLQLNIKSGTTTVKNFYIERIDKKNEISILRKILWSSKNGVTISSIYYKNEKIKEQLTEKYSWSTL